METIERGKEDRQTEKGEKRKIVKIKIWEREKRNIQKKLEIKWKVTPHKKRKINSENKWEIQKWNKKEQKETRK